MNCGVLLIFVSICLANFAFCQQRGTQLRLTQKGLDYTIQEALKILRKDLSGKRFRDFRGRDSGFSYTVSNLNLRSLIIGSGKLTTSTSSGLTASASGISTSISGRLRYEKRVWGFKISDTVNINARAYDVSFSMSVSIGKGPGGKPTLGVNSCSSNVGRLRIQFSGSKASWLYNLFSSVVERNLKGQLSTLMCRSATESLKSRGASELAQFKVKKAIDKFAMIDYSMTDAPKFTNQYMDFYIRGEFLSRSNPTKHSLLPMPNFPSMSVNSKMVYIWLSDYTINTAGEVYHNSGILSRRIDGNTKTISPMIKMILNTNRFKILVPELARRYPNRPLAIRIHSYKPPKVEVKSGEIYLYIYAAATFQVQPRSGKYVDVFSIELDIKTDGTVSVTGKNVKGNVKDFSLQMKTTKSTVGPVNIPVHQPFLQNLVRGAILQKAREMLQKGFPLPNLDDISFINPEIKLEKGVIRVGVDCKYTR